MLTNISPGFNLPSSKQALRNKIGVLFVALLIATASFLFLESSNRDKYGRGRARTWRDFVLTPSIAASTGFMTS